MPSAPTAATQDTVAPFFEDAGIPATMAPLFWEALDAAGYTVVEKSGGSAVQTIDTIEDVERIAVTGAPGVFVVGLKLGTNGWLVWRELYLKDGSIERSAPAFIPGDVDLLAT
ncbi:MAG: hypothetical protein AMXMBFR58_29720 [Phycisphaerae bacterium]